MTIKKEINKFKLNPQFERAAEDYEHICNHCKKDSNIISTIYKNDIVERISFKDSKTINYQDAEKVGKMIIENFEKEEFDVCTIFYNKFKNVITQIPQEQQIIPLKTSEAEENSSEDNYEFEPDEDEILSNL